MTIPGCISATAAMDQLSKLRQYAPYRFGGKWFVSAWAGEGRCYRSLSALRKAASKAGLESVEVLSITPTR